MALTTLDEEAVSVAALDALHPLDPVEVLNQFTNSWSSGFEVAEVLWGMGEYRYRIRRLSDREILPVLFAEDRLILAR